MPSFYVAAIVAGHLLLKLCFQAMNRLFAILNLVVLFASLAGVATASAQQATKTQEADEAYWDYGLGFGAVRLEQYPASNQYRLVALPAPTFHYRGKILRADDRDGAHLYLYKGTTTTLEFSGQGLAALDSADNRAREGMADLPWMIAIGPEIVYRPTTYLKFGLSALQAVSTDFVMTRGSGILYEGRAVYSSLSPFSEHTFFNESGTLSQQWTLALKGGSKEFLSVYFDVPEEFTRADRPAYDSRSGLLQSSLSYFLALKSGRVSVYTGLSVNSYALSANRLSPLHKSDYNLVALVGFNYIFGESGRPAVPDAETSSVIESIDSRRKQRQ
jgi:outer membrane protein